MADNQKVTQALAILTAAYPNNKVTRETIMVYQIALQDIPSDVLEQAILHITTTSKFFPAISEIRDAAYMIMVETNKIPSAFEAWGEAIDHCRRSEYKNYSHPLIEKAVNTIGIAYWQRMTYDDEMATRAQFFRIYESLYVRAMDEMKMLPQVKEFQKKYELDGQIKLLAEKMSMKKEEE
jgi:hypothetical protein